MRSEWERYLLNLSYRHWACFTLIPSLPHTAPIFAYSVKRRSSKYCSIFVIPFCSYGRRHEIRVQEIFIVSLLQALGQSHSDPLITSHSSDFCVQYSAKRKSEKCWGIFVNPFHSCGKRHEIRVREIIIVSLLQAFGRSRSDPLITSHCSDILCTVLSAEAVNIAAYL